MLSVYSYFLYFTKKNSIIMKIEKIYKDKLFILITLLLLIISFILLEIKIDFLEIFQSRSLLEFF